MKQTAKFRSIRKRLEYELILKVKKKNFCKLPSGHLNILAIKNIVKEMEQVTSFEKTSRDSIDSSNSACGLNILKNITVYEYEMNTGALLTKRKLQNLILNQPEKRSGIAHMNRYWSRTGVFGNPCSSREQCNRFQ